MNFAAKDFEIKDLAEQFNDCEAKGLIKPKKNIDVDLIISLIAGSDLLAERISVFGHTFEAKTKNYGLLLRDKYEILRMLIDAFLLFDEVNISNHQCSNAYLCKKHPDLMLEWEVLETMRILRNSVSYQGKPISEEKWDSIKAYFETYTFMMRKEVKKKLGAENP